MSASDLVKTWKEKAAQKAAERAANVISVPVTFGGFTGKAHRLHLHDWARAGKLPQYLASAMFAAVQGKSTEMHESDVTPEQQAEWLRCQSMLFCAMMDEPKFSTQEMRKERWLQSSNYQDGYIDQLQDDEIDYADFVLMAPEALQEAVQWQINGCPDIPIQTETGVMSLAELETFRNSGEWLATPESFYSESGVYWDTKPTARVI